MDEEKTVPVEEMDDEDLFMLSSILRDKFVEGDKDAKEALERVEVERLTRRAKGYDVSTPEGLRKAEQCLEGVRRIQEAGLGGPAQSVRAS